MANKLCGSCGKAVNRQRPGLQCSSFCNRFYHGECVGVVGQQLDNLRIEGISWTCPHCRGRTRASFAGPQASVSEDSPIGDSSLGTLEEIRTELRMIREQQALLLESVNFCSNKISDFEVEISKMNNYIKITDQLSNENAMMKKELEELRERINDTEQVSRLNNVEIQGVPEKRDENLFKILEKIGEHINYEMTSSVIDYANRVQTNRNSERNQGRNIIVRFTSRRERDRFLMAAKTKRMENNGNPKLSLVNVSEAFYINEHLTLANKLLFKDVRLAAKAKDYKYVWVKNGAVFYRKDDASKIVLVLWISC
ncbi:uncharacterized protein LOC123321907 [Coccinella septempunctata]|uniref:uncharacterized protein LOC123321907 n=1 Tax=Coccinella septempunctata TaxID=41139 RepID=UPI001D07FB03|nr:uncharacterized protein LOC123321907 [Coccinella septempunctata]